MTATKYRKGTLEAHLDSILPEWESFNVYFWELHRDCASGWMVNGGWRGATEVDREGAIEALRCRWKVFKENYLPKARVRDIGNVNWDSDNPVMLEVDFTSFAELRKPA